MKWIYLFLIFSPLLHGATIGIIDTGFDLDHEFLRPKILKQETDEEAIDPELKSKFHGWSFHDNSHVKVPVIQNQDLLADILKYRNLRAKGHKQGLTPEEYEWFNQKRIDTEFRSELKKFKKHIHGTVVASIALREGDNINIFPIRGLNIDIPVVAIESEIETPGQTSTAISGIKKFEQEIKLSRQRVNRKFTKICLYLSLKKINIVNASYGITHKNIATKFQEMYREYVGEEIPAPLLSQYIDDYFNDIYQSAIKTIKRYPNILFVFSAGNSGLNNDLFHHYPSRVKLDNTIAVAATNGDFLASFSNFGKSKVDIGAPGVGIQSIIPRVYSPNGTDVFSTSSGTSMAAPYISNLAAQISNANPKLKPWQIKKIILETGDQKAHLEDKLISKSIANNAKALKASNLSKEIALEHAIQLATLEIVPLQDEISLNFSPAKTYQETSRKLFNSLPAITTPNGIDDDETDEQEQTPIKKDDSTKSSSSSPTDQVTEQPDNSVPLPSTDQVEKNQESDQDHSNQTPTQSLKPSEDLPPSSSQLPPSPPENQSPELEPSLPQS